MLMLITKENTFVLIFKKYCNLYNCYIISVTKRSNNKKFLNKKKTGYTENNVLRIRLYFHGMH